MISLEISVIQTDGYKDRTEMDKQLLQLSCCATSYF